VSLYRILGPLEVERDGVLVALPAAKHRVLLLALLVRRGAVCSTDQLIDALWERPPASAGKVLQAYVSHLRTVLGADTIETVPPGYRLRVDADQVDAGRFEQLHDRARAALDAGNPELAGALAARAGALWRGSALADVAYAGFADREAARLEELRAQCTQVRLDAELALGRHEQAIGELLRLCEDHPLREPLHERLALALYRSGRQVDALAALAATRARLLDELGLDPGRTFQDLEHGILTQDPALDPPMVAVSPAPRTVPKPASELVGRRREIAELQSLLVREEVRLITVNGAGGSGKTRLALEVAEVAGPAFANGVVLVELASISDPALVVPALAHALGLSETADTPVRDVVVDWLRSRQVLLVVDNFEQVVDAAAELAALVTQAPLISVLVTSRRVLHVTGEHVYPLGPLTLDDASQLFAARAAARDPSLGIGSDDDDVRDICTRLDCLPLAVEIAAARTVALDPRSMRDRLRVSIGALGPGPRDAPARQQTLTDAIRWSTDLLTDAERRVLARFSVFVGGCDLAAVEAVCEADLDTVGALVDWSLLLRGRAAGTHRFGMLDTIRHHASDLLEVLGERAAAEADHSAHYRTLAEEATPVGTSQPETLERLDPEIDNLRAAQDRAAASGDHTTALQVATALYPYWYVRGLFREGRDRIAAALAPATPDGDLHARALRSLASMHYLLGEDEAAEEAAARGVEVGTAAGSLEQVSACHTVRGLVAERHDRLEYARECILASAEVARALGRDVDVMVAEHNLGDIARRAGDLDAARLHYETAHEWHQQNGSDSTFSQIGLGAVARGQGRLDDADRHLAAALEYATQTNRPHNTLLAMLGQAAVAVDRGDFIRAGELLGAVRALAAATTGELVGDELEDYRDTEAAVVVAIGAEGLADLLSQGPSDATTDGPPRQ
jgi:predicted ATPase/DNA-binding SARP family transcriptional activator